MQDQVAPPKVEHCHVARILPFGLLVTLDNGRTGIIRERELAWNKDERSNWRHRYKIGEAVDAVVIDGPIETPELSIRYARHDPWLDAHERFQPGQIVDGTVTGVQHYGAFVQLGYGVTGLLHKSALPDWVDRPIEEVLWVGDRVKMQVEWVDPLERRIGLSMRRLHDHRWESAPLLTQATGSSATSKPASIADGPSREHMLRQLADRLPRRVLIVDDDSTQRDALSGWAQRANQRVAVAENADVALGMLDELAPDLVVMDVGMPGTDGIAAIQRVRAQYPHIQCVVMTDWSRADERSRDLEQLADDGVLLLMKPVFPEDFLEVLLGMCKPIVSAQRIAPPGELKQTTFSAGHLKNTLKANLGIVRKAMKASHAVLFSVDLAQQQIQAIAHEGSLTLRPKAMLDLIFSPVRDLAESRRGLFMLADAQLHPARVRYLLPFVDFGACIGAPAPSEGNVRYVLMCFYASSFEFDETHADILRIGAMGLGATLAQHDYSKRLEESQRFALLGHLTRGLVHEINHQLAPILYSVEDLRSQHDHIINAPEHTRQAPQQTPQQMLLEDTSRRHDLIAQLERSVRTLAETTRMFGKVTVQGGQFEALRLDEIVGEAIVLARDMADRSHVRMHIEEPKRLLFVQSHALSILQSTLNILINAIQHISLARPASGGQVHVRFAQRQRTKDTAVQIIVEDDGPGVHRALLERIFELGFTTRTVDGSGQGLYIARRLIEALNGKVFVSETKVLWGSTFVIELPSSVLSSGMNGGES